MPSNVQQSAVWKPVGAVLGIFGVRVWARMSHTTSAVVAAAFVSTAKMGADTQADSWADFLSILQVFTGRSSTPALNVLSSWVFLVPVLAVSIVVARSGWPRALMLRDFHDSVEYGDKQFRPSNNSFRFKR